MSKRVWLHIRGLFLTATPVTVLARGAKRAHVKLRHSLRWKRKDFAAGSTRHVPVYALGEKPWPGSLVSVGRNRYVPQMTPQGRKAVARG